MRGRQVLGFDAGGTKLLGGIVDSELRLSYRILRRWHGGGRDEVIEVIAEAVAEARAAAGDEVEAVGFGIPSLVDYEHGYSIASVHLPLDETPFRDLMQERLGLPVYVDNDANLAALAEQRHGAARGAQQVVLLTLGTGIGGGLILDGEVYRGSRGTGAELGHMTIDIDGPPCPGKCPNHGCLEALVSGQAMGRDGLAAAEREPDSALGHALGQGLPITGEAVTELALGGDAAARAVIERIGERLGAGIASLVNIFNPEVVVIGGGAARGGELLLGPARRALAERALPPNGDSVRVVGARFGEEAGMLGAALLALESS